MQSMLTAAFNKEVWSAEFKKKMWSEKYCRQLQQRDLGLDIIFDKYFTLANMISVIVC